MEILLELYADGHREIVINGQCYQIEDARDWTLTAVRQQTGAKEVA